MNTGVWQRLATELDYLLDCDTLGREQRLAALETDDPELASRLRAALDADSRELVLLDEPLSLRLERSDDSDETAASGVSAGGQLGPWRLERELGQGGMGQVWLATRDDGQYQLEVAIKLIDGVLDSDLVREQLRRERQILADLDHPNIARLLDGGIRDNGTPWYAMEYVHGLPLDQYAQQHALSLPARLRLLAIVAQAVQHAHGRLVVHRDLKPGNILVDTTGTPHLLDFGIAKLLDAGSAAQSGPLTLLAAATPAYAAPEQLRGEQVDTAADIYALGVIAFELIVGTRPPQPDSQVADGDRGPLPSRLIPDRRQRASVRGDIDAIVSQALAPQSKDRYGAAKAMADDIQRHLDGLPVEARAAGTGYRARKFVRRHRWGVAAGAVAAVALCAALAFSIVQTRHAQAQLARANAVQGFLLGVFDATQPTAGGSFVITQRELADRAIDLLDEQLAGQADAGADVLIAVGRVYRKLGFADRARAVLQRALTHLEALPENGHERHRVVALLALGRADYLAGDLKAATRHLAQADRLASEHATDTSTRAAILYELGSSQSAQLDIEAALGTLGRAEKLAASDTAARLILPKILLEKALAYRRSDDMDAAIAQGRRSLAAARRAYGIQDVRTSSVLSTLGAMLRKAGQLAEAEVLLRQAVAIEEQAYGQPQSASVNNLATVLQDRGQLDESAALFQKALQLAQQRFGADSARTASYLRNLALAQADAGQTGLAVANLRKAYARFTDANPLGTPANLEMRAQLARVLYQAGKSGEAAKLLPEILAEAPQHHDAGAIPLGQAHQLRARLALDGGKLAQARRHLDAARKRTAPRNLETTDQIRLKLLSGDVSGASGNTVAARQDWQSALDLARTRLAPQHVLAKAAACRLGEPDSLPALELAPCGS